MKEVIFPRGHAIEEEHTITATVIAARAAIDERGDVTLIYRGGDGSTFTLRHALDKYTEYTVSQRIRELEARLYELGEEKSSILREIETEKEYLLKARKATSPNQ